MKNSYCFVFDEVVCNQEQNDLTFGFSTSKLLEMAFVE